MPAFRWIGMYWQWTRGHLRAKLAYCRGLTEEERPNVPEKTLDGTGRTVLVAAGSATPVTKRQLGILLEDQRHVQVSVDPIPLIDGAWEATEEASQPSGVLWS